MTQREEFEAWFHKYDDNNFMTAEDREFMFEAWQAAREQAVPQWTKTRDGLPKCMKPVWVISKGKVSRFQWIYDVGDNVCWFEPWTPHFTNGSTLDIDSVEMWVYCDLPPSSPEQNK